MGIHVSLFALVEKIEDIREYMGISYIKSYLVSKGVLCDSRVIYRSQMDEILNQYKEFPEIIGISVYCNTIELTKAFCEKIRRISSTCHIVLGGAHVMGYEEDILMRMPTVDSVCTGEGELTFLELADRIDNHKSLRGCKGITYRKDGKIVRNERRNDIRDLNELPWPERENNAKNKKRYFYITGSRGCLGKCTFCAEHVTAGGGVRLRDPVDIVDEIEELWKKYGVNKFHFTDATFEDPGQLGLERAKRIFREIIDRDLQLRLVMYTRTNIVTRMDDEYYDLAYRAGVECYFVGVESGNQKDLDLYNKKITVEDNYKAIKLLLNHHVYVNYGFICFNPYSTFDQIKENIEFLHNSGLVYNSYHILSKMTIMPQARLKDMMKEDGLIQEFHFDSDIRDYKFVNPDIGIFRDYLYGKIHTKHLIDLDSQIAIDRFHYEKVEPLLYEEKLKVHFDEVARVWQERNHYLYLFFMEAIHLYETYGIREELNQHVDKNIIYEYDRKIRNLYRKYISVIYKFNREKRMLNE